MAHSHLCDDGKCLVPTFDGAFLSSDSRDAMGQVLHGSATTTRRSIERYSIVMSGRRSQIKGCLP
jgi:hypothetical protein